MSTAASWAQFTPPGVVRALSTQRPQRSTVLAQLAKYAGTAGKQGAGTKNKSGVWF